MAEISLFLTVLFTVFIAEMGDKTQLMLIAMSSKYKVLHIAIGTGAAILVLNGIAVVSGGLLNEFLKSNLWCIKLIAATAFFFFSLTSLLKEDEEEDLNSSRFNFAPLAVFCIFFIAELGDKTQLTAITFGATNGLNPSSVIIWAASSAGLFAADIIGLVLGKLLNGRTPEFFFKALAFLIFAIFGVKTLYDGVIMLNGANNTELSPVIVTIVVSVIFFISCGLIFFRQKAFKK